MFHRKLSLFLFSAALLAVAACEEEPPYIDMTPKDTSLKDTTFMEGSPAAVQARVVLIEDFTGVRCKNCPDAQGRAHEIDSTYPGRVVIMGLHPSQTFNTLTYPYDLNKDFRTDYAEDIMNMLTPPPALPYGTVNRKYYSGESARMLEYGKWQAKVEQEMLISSKVNIEFLEKKKQGDTLVVTVKVVYNDTAAAAHAISIILTESDIIGPQEMPDGDTINTYKHNHVLRTMGTPFNGVLLAKQNSSPVYEKQRAYIRQFKIVFKPAWVPANCHIVAVVAEVVSLNVVQVAETEVQ